MELAPCPMCKDMDELLTLCPMCGDTERVLASVAALCMHPDCTNPPYKNGAQCQEHGCHQCGGVILADTEDWKKPLCYDCWHAIGETQAEPPEIYNGPWPKLNQF